MNAVVSHFSLEELTFSQIALRKGLPNDPNHEQIENLYRLRDTLLEPARHLWGDVRVIIDSGFRSPPVNAAVGGEPDSAHMDGRAGDTRPQGILLRTAFNLIRASDLPYDQVILECNAWIHLAVARLGAAPRRQALLAKGYPGHWSYSLA